MHRRIRGSQGSRGSRAQRGLALGLATAWILAAAPAVLAQQGPGAARGADTATAPASALPEGLTAGDWSSIRAAYEVGRHAVRAVDGGHQARNPRQQWTTLFDGRGFTTTPEAGG